MAPYLRGAVGHESGVADRMLHNKEEIRARIEETGIVPALRSASGEDALYVAESLSGAGVPVLEIAANRPGALDAISCVAKRLPRMVVGAGAITSLAMARRCTDAGANFLASDVLMLDVVEFAAKEKMAFLPGAFTPTEIVAAWNAGCDFVRVFPCNAAGGSSYIRSVKAAMPEVALIASGGVTQQTGFDLIAAGAAALAIGGNLIPAEAVRLRQTARIQELARRFLDMVDNGRIEAAGRNALA